MVTINSKFIFFVIMEIVFKTTIISSFLIKGTYELSDSLKNDNENVNIILLSTLLSFAFLLEYIGIICSFSMLIIYFKNYGKHFEDISDLQKWKITFVIYKMKIFNYFLLTIINIIITILCLTFLRVNGQLEYVRIIIFYISFVSILKISLVSLYFIYLSYVILKHNRSLRRQVELNNIKIEFNFKKIERNQIDEPCCICLELDIQNPSNSLNQLNQWIELDCKHKFHEICIEPWLQKNNSCPLCRNIEIPIS